MAASMYILAVLLVVPLLCFVIEFFLAAKHPTGGLVFPVVIMCLFVLFGYITLIWGAIMFLIYFIVQHLKKKKDAEEQKKLAEMDRMNIHDLD